MLFFSLGFERTGYADLTPQSMLTDEERQLFEETFHGGLRYEAIATETMVDLEAWLSSGATYRVYSNDGPERIEVHRFQEMAGDSAFEYTLNDQESQFLTLVGGEDLEISGAIDRKEGVRTEFLPPKPLVPDGFSRGDTLRRHVKVRISDVVRSDRIRHQGELDVVLTNLGGFHARWSDGDVDLLLLRVESQGKIGPATLVHRQYWFFSGDGLAAFVEARKISAFGIYQKSDRQGWLRCKAIE